MSSKRPPVHLTALVAGSRATVLRWTEHSNRILRRLQSSPTPLPLETQLNFLMSTDDGPIKWWFQGDGRRLEGETRDFSDIPAEARQAPVHVWTPARATRISSVTFPTKNTKKMVRALPYLFEETTLDEPEALHFAYQTRADGLLTVAITARAAVARWLKRFNDAGFSPSSFCPVSLGLACDPPRTAALAFVGDRAFARTGEWTAFSCTPTLEAPGPEIAASAAASAAEGIPLQRLIVQSAPAGFDTASWESALGFPVESRPGLAFRASVPFNLLQGDFAPAAVWKKALSAWRPVLALFGVWLAATFLVNTWDVVRLTSAQRRVQTDSVQLYRSIFPDATTILDPSIQMSRNLEALRAQAGGLRSNDFLSLMESISSAVGGTTGVSVRKIDYDNGALTATISVPDFRTLESFKAALDKAVGAEWLGAESRGGAVEARFRVREAAQ